MSGLSHIPQFDPRRIYLFLREEIDQAVSEVLDSGTYIGGEAVGHFEQQLASFVGEGKEYRAVSCANGTDALALALSLSRLKPGDEVLMPSHTYVAAAEMAVSQGLIPVWVDVEKEGYNVDPDPEHLEACMSRRTKAMVAVNIYGMPAAWPRLKDFCHNHGLLLIEDNAQGLGGSLDGKALGSWGDVSTLSFFPTKPLGCMGDGGAVLGPSSDDMQRIAMLARHGQQGKYNYIEPGRNSRLDALQAAILSVKLRYLSQMQHFVRVIARSYAEALSDIEGLLLPQCSLLPNAQPSWHLFTIRVLGGQRDALRAFLSDRRIAAGLYYPAPLHRVPCYARIASPYSSPCIETDRLSEEILSLPIFPLMREEECERVVDAVRSFFMINR